MTDRSSWHFAHSPAVPDVPAQSHRRCRTPACAVEGEEARDGAGRVHVCNPALVPLIPPSSLGVGQGLFELRRWSKITLPNVTVSLYSHYGKLGDDFQCPAEV